MKKRNEASEAVRVGFVSRLDFGSEGYRKGLLELAWEIFRKEKVHFVVLAGGLINQNTLLIAPPKREEDRREYVDRLAREIVAVLPRMEKTDTNGNNSGLVNGNGKRNDFIRTYIVTSKPFDGWVGAQVAKRLAELRPEDIRYQGQGHATVRLKQIGKTIRVLVPEKAPWRSQYYATPAQRLVIDDAQRTGSPDFDLYVVGCLASSLLKPAGGEFKRSFTTVPALHKLEQLTSTENQIGVKVIEFSSTNGIRVRTYNFKDLIAKERQFINIPARSSEIQGAIIEALKTHGPLTAGLLEDFLRVPREQIEQEIETLKRFRVGIVYDESSDRYDFGKEWFRDKIRYRWPKEEDFRENTILGFGCLHAGSRYTDSEFFVNEVPDLLSRWKVDVLVGAGDFIEGLKHDLLTRGEVFGGLNNTQQERLASTLVGAVIFKAFRDRFKALFKDAKKDKAISQERLGSMIDEALIIFVYEEGNHDQWQQNAGFTPLYVFRSELVQFLVRAIGRFLADRGLGYSMLHELVERKVINLQGGELSLASGATLQAYHPHNARMVAVTGRLQQLIPISSASVIFAANWHVHAGLEHWESARGQIVGVQLGTIKVMSDYEESKGKRVDFGVGLTRIKTFRGRIFVSETVFHGKPRMKTPHDNEDIMRELLKKLGVTKLVS